MAGTIVVMSRHAEQQWRVVVPVKGQLSAKSRLHPPAGVRRSDLAHAFAIDTLAAVHACIAVGHLVVVTSDQPTRQWASARDGAVVPDPGSGLNGAIRAGVAAVPHLVGDGPTAVLLGDLPTLRPDELALALKACGAHERSFVPDAEGTGTVLLAASRSGLLQPRFGTVSARAHARDHVTLDLDLPALRSDVDDDRALARALSLGVGERTSTVLGPARH